MLERILLTAALAALSCTAALADNSNDWQLQVKKQANGWTANFSSAQSYGPAGKRIQGSGKLVEKARNIAAFTKLRLEGPMTVRLTQAGADAAKVAADDNIEPMIETLIEGDTLVLRMQAGAAFTTRNPPTVLVDSKNLQSISLKGSGDVSMERFKGDSLTLNLTGSGDIRLGLLELRELSATLIGSGDLQAAGRAETQNWTLNGSGDVDARSLSGRSIKASLHGSGDLSLGVADTLEADLNGSGDLSYAGRPQLRQSVKGTGEISRR
jgi:hypothetical protein